MIRLTLLKEWILIHTKLGLYPSFKEFNRIFAAYSEQHRKYHTARHLLDTINFVNIYYGKTLDTALVKLALFYHDVVYDVMSKTNEEDSAEQWRAYARKLKRIEPSHIKLIEMLILSTKSHRLSAGSTLVFKMMNDADMSIFLRDKPRYLQYARDIWEEFSVYGKEQYIEGRIQFLESLDPSSIFYTHQVRGRSHQAHENILEEIKQLTSNPKFLA